LWTGGTRTSDRHVVRLQRNHRSHWSPARWLARRSLLAMGVLHQCPAGRDRSALAEEGSREPESGPEAPRSHRRHARDRGLGGLVYGLIESSGQGLGEPRPSSRRSLWAVSGSWDSFSGKRGAPVRLLPLSLFRVLRISLARTLSRSFSTALWPASSSSCP
jgi:hypothetical protein